MSKKAPIPSLDFYQNNSNLKWVVLVASVLISIGSIYYTNVLVDQLKERERQQVQLYAKAIEYTANDDDSGDVNFIASGNPFSKQLHSYHSGDRKRQSIGVPEC